MTIPGGGVGVPRAVPYICMLYYSQHDMIYIYIVDIIEP